MSLLQPFTCTCYPLRLPAAQAGSGDEYVRRKQSLDCRTGAAVTLTRSNIFVHGGLTIPLNLEKVTCAEIQNQVVLYFAKEKDCSAGFKDLKQWLSPEIFFLDLISRTWNRVDTTVESETMLGAGAGAGAGTATGTGMETDPAREAADVDVFANEQSLSSSVTLSVIEQESFRERLFHSMCYVDGNIFVFGGLVMSPQNGYEFTASNELWRLDLRTKQWSLVSRNPLIQRRFNHSMHVKNEHSDTRDTKIVIVGGLNNLDEPVHKVDIYNLTRGYWQSVPDSEFPIELETNIEGKPVDLATDSCFSILVENNEAKIPALAFYKPLSCRDHSVITSRSKKAKQVSGRSSVDTEMAVCDSDTGTKEQDEQDPNSQSPIVALPIVSGSKGIRMASHPLQPNDLLEAPLNLLNPTGDYFGYNIVIGGFCPTLLPSDFHCYIYDIPSGKWTRIGITCPDCEINTHRFWKLFVWDSHHQALVLGTKNDDGYLPSVQKFDHLLSFGLPIINIFNKGIHSVPSNKDAVMSVPDSKFGSSGVSDLESDLNRMSFASSQTSQFESYIRYIAPPYEMTSIRSVFPAYAMVLGKDALEIYGKPLSDFELVSSEGEAIGVPLYLLRKRWGRYFDLLLSQGYSKACTEYEASGNLSTLIKLTPFSSRTGSRDIHSSRLSSSSSLDNYFVKGIGAQHHHYSVSGPAGRKPPGSENIVDRTSRSSVDGHLMGSSPNPMSESVYLTHIDDVDDDDDDCVGPTSQAKNTNKMKSVSRTITSSTTSSTGGMVFRVPFQEKKPSSSVQDIAPDSQFFQTGSSSRRSSLLSSQTMGIQRSPKIEGKRRASHPIISSIMDKGQPVSTRSVGSTRSSLSYVSSSSERQSKSHLPGSRNSSVTGSPILGVLNVPLPPPCQTPTEPVPPPPVTKYPNITSKPRTNSMSEVFNTIKGSPLSSRRSSYSRKTSTSEVNSAIDRQLMEDRFKEADMAFAKQTPTKPVAGSKMPENIRSSTRNSVNNDWSRHSFASVSDSSESATVNGNIEMEPMLIPRTLYLPWSTATVHAFAEFFYTGQVNGKWMLSPVVLDLLVISKLYELPLLFNLISEVLYSIVGKKEEGMYITCKSLIDSFSRKVSTYFGNDKEKEVAYLESCEAYKILKKIKLCLERIDNGFFDLDLMRRHSMSRSSYNSSNGSTVEKKNSLDLSPRGSSNLPTMMGNGPRDSHVSIESLNYPMHMNIPSSRRSTGTFAHRTTKKSSLSKEIDPSFFNDTSSTLSLHDTAIVRDFNEKIAKADTITEKDYSSTSSSSSCDLDDESDQEKLRHLSETDFATILDTRDSKSHQLNTKEDINNFDFSLGLLSSFNDEKNKLRKVDVDEPIDPLAKISHNLDSPNRLYSKYSQGFGKMPKSGSQASNMGLLTLENLASPNALPPDDAVIKAIHQTTVLANEVRLMIRCGDCLQISKDLRRCKKIMNSELTKLEKTHNVSESRTSISASSSQTRLSDYQSSTNSGKITPTAGGSVTTMDPLVKSKLKQNLTGQELHPGIHFVETLHSPKSVADFESKETSSQPGVLNGLHTGLHSGFHAGLHTSPHAGLHSKPQHSHSATKIPKVSHKLGKATTSTSLKSESKSPSSTNLGKKEHNSSLGPLSFFGIRNK
ncbi:Kelch motif [Nakaseomyces glabratus]|nr:Kelch motif [Nakaseomyces glabratus]KAH7608343.1 Kelch motif [Nakaseomyces glabratus]